MLPPSVLAAISNRVRRSSLQVGILTSVPDPHSLVIEKAKPVSFPLSQALCRLAWEPALSPQEPSFCVWWTFSYPLRPCVGPSVLTSKTDFQCEGYNLLSLKPQFIPQQTVESSKLGLGMIRATLIECCSFHCTLSLLQIGILWILYYKRYCQLRIDVKLPFPFLFVKLTTLYVVFISQFQKILRENPCPNRAIIPISLQPV